MSLPKSLIISITLTSLLSACNSNPIDEVEKNIDTGSVDKVPELSETLPTPTAKSDLPDLLQQDRINDPLKKTADKINLDFLDQKQPAPSPTVAGARTNAPVTTTSTQTTTKAIINTTAGPIAVKLFPQIAPKTIANFQTKISSNYYNNLTFHRVEDWVVQGGDPLGNGTGGGDMPTELSQQPFKIGSVGVARGGDINISNDSQFFICKSDCSFLTGQYTLFGEVVSGMDAVNQLKIGDKIISISSQ